MKLHTFAALTCSGFLAATSAYALDDQFVPADNMNNSATNNASQDQTMENQTLADNTSAGYSDGMNSNTVPVDNSPDTLTHNPRANDNVGALDMSSQSAQNNTSTDPTDIGSSNAPSNNELSPDTATGDDN